MKLDKRTVPTFCKKENKLYSVSSFLYVCDWLKLDHSKQRFPSTEHWCDINLRVYDFVCEKSFHGATAAGSPWLPWLVVSVARCLLLPKKKNETFSQIMLLALPPLPKAMPIDNFEYCHAWTVLLCQIKLFAFHTFVVSFPGFA